MKLGRKVDHRVENDILLKAKAIRVQKQASNSICKQLNHNKDTIRLHAIKTILKQPNRVNYANELVAMLLDPYENIRKVCVESYHLFTPIRMFGPLIIRTVASGLVHIVPSIRLDMLKLLHKLCEIPQYLKYIDFDLFMPTLVKIYNDTAKLTFKSASIACLVSIHSLRCTSSDNDTLLRHLFIDTPIGKIPYENLGFATNIEKVLASHWIETNSANDMLNILKFCLFYDFKLNSALVLSKFPFKSDSLEKLNPWVCCLYLSDETRSWVEMNWTSIVFCDLNSILPHLFKVFGPISLSKGVNRLNWKQFEESERIKMLELFKYQDVGPSSLFFTKMLFISVAKKMENLTKLLSTILHYHLSKHTTLRRQIYKQLEPLVNLKIKDMHQKGPIFSQRREVVEIVLNLYQFATPNELNIGSK